MELQIWDTAGVKVYQGLIKNFMKESNAFVLVYDVASKFPDSLQRRIHADLDKDSFEAVKVIAKDVKSLAPEAQLYIVGNKIDIKERY